jgi:carboxymethylenebutenolidase
MCFDLDSRPPIAPIAGGSLDHESITLTAEDGNRFRAFRARATMPSGAGVVILPDVRGLHPYYEELALRFAEAGVDAVALDWFGRTAGLDTPRDDAFDYTPHVQQTTWTGIAADIRAAAAEARSDAARVHSLFTIGFCFGGQMAFDSATLGLGLTGAIGFYGPPLRDRGNGTPIPVDVASEMEGAVLGLFGGGDAGIPPEAVAAFGDALTAAGVDHRLVSYEGAPHSFFDRKAAEFADASDAAWTEVLTFITTKTSAREGTVSPA